MKATQSFGARWLAWWDDINPAWRESRVHLVAISDWDYNVPKSEMMRRQVELNEFVAPTLKSVTGGVGTYLNEGNFEEVDWQNWSYFHLRSSTQRLPL